MLIVTGILALSLLTLAFLFKREAERRQRAEQDHVRLKLELEQTLDRYRPIVNAEREAESVREALRQERGSVSAELSTLTTRTHQELVDHRNKITAELSQLRTRATAEVEFERATAQSQLADIRTQTIALRDQYHAGLKQYQELSSAVTSLEESLEDISLGMYEPHFTYADSEAHKEAIKDVRQKLKWHIKSGLACVSNRTITLEGSEAQGRAMIKQYQKIMLRAFNAESDACIANVTWNNYNAMSARIHKAYSDINELGTRLFIRLADSYRDLRLLELNLVFEAAEKKQQEREEARRVRAEQREEEKVQRELERTREEAAKDETRFEKALTKARSQLEHAMESEREAMQARIAELEADVAEAHERKERAIAQAQLTKAGHVYIISNVGAFGERIVKIGLTRRLEPEERIKELGDASVPFPFDLHALIYSEDAPSLETRLHDRFWQYRLNWANDRKEFFRIPLAEVHAAIGELGLSCAWCDIPEAREYRETLVLLERASGETARERASAPQFLTDPFHIKESNQATTS